MKALHQPAAALAWLRSPAAIRSRCAALLELAERDRLDHFAVDADRIDAAADYVAEVIAESYPTLEVPLHSRWRQFSAGGIDRWGALARGLANTAPDEVARIRIDLAVTSVLLDAGAGAGWRFREPGSGACLGRSEGLAAASLHLFAAGALSARPGVPLRADAEALARIDSRSLAAAFQANHDNPLVGLDGRAAVLRRLGEALAAAPDMFGATAPRIGNLFNYLAGRARDGRVPAPAILDAVLRALGAVWPGRTAVDGVSLGDVWRHPAIRTRDLTDGLVPFHKLAQWLTYSLVEPLAEAGLEVTELDALTGLAEYRNGGLLVDLGVLAPKHDAVLAEVHPVDGEIVVEWRALTVALLDRLADAVRARLDVDAASLPLVKLLEGGTWRAGRKIAASLRADGGPPIRVASDGTVF